MKSLQQGSKKIQEIADILKNEAIEPAKKQAEGLIAEAQGRAEQIIEDAEKQAERILSESRDTLEQERKAFQSSMTQASKLFVETLKQEIVHKLFDQELSQILAKETSEAKVVAKLIEAIVNSIDKEGISSDLAAVVPQAVSPEEVTGLLSAHVLDKLKNNPVRLDGFSGGAQVKLLDKKITIDISDTAIKEFLAGYRKDFRKWIFGNQ